jgi:inosine-uridine nucleoside N-ribohydrolase
MYRKPKQMFGLSVVLVLVISPSLLGAGPVPVIFDTDMGNDIDDALALAVIHALETRQECELIGVTLTKEHPLAAPFVDAVNTFYGRGTIPIGIVRDGKGPAKGSYLEVSTRKDSNGHLLFPHDLTEGQQVEDAVTLLRRLLSQAADHSVVILQVGFSTNLARLLDSQPDEISDLSGFDLARQKVHLLSTMAGHFAGRLKEFNIIMDRDSAASVFSTWPTEIVFSGFEIGLAILYPAVSIEQDFDYVENHPIPAAYRAFGNMPYHRPTFDLTSVLYAVRPDREYFGLSETGKVVVDSEGRTSFTEDPEGKHRYMILSEAQKEQVREALVQLTSQPPCGPGH